MKDSVRRPASFETAETILADIKDPGLRRQLERFGQVVMERAECEPEPPQRPEKGKVIQLPLWPEPKRGVPNSALRGALFAAIQGKDRRALKRELLFVQQGIVV